MITTRQRRSAAHRIFSGVAASAALILGAALLPQSALAATTHSISGTVHFAVTGGTTAPGSTARLYSLTGNGGQARQVSYAYTSGTQWTLGNVPDGRYRILFEVSHYGNGANASIWYGDTPFEDSAKIVTVSGGNVAGLQVSQPAAGSISGTVTAPPSHNGVNGYQAYLLNPTTGLFEMVPGRPEANVDGTGNYTISGLNPGQYVVRFADGSAENPLISTQYYKNSPDLWDSTLVTVAAGQKVVGINGSLGSWGWASGRIAGADRFSTATQISADFYGAGHANVAYIANGLSYPDALSASAAAAYLGGPLLLVTPTSVPATVTAELKRLKPPKIVVVGGTAAVSGSVYSTLSRLAPAITRVSGSDRYETSRAIAANAFPGSRDSVFLATGANYPDALVAGSAAGYEGSPLILVNGAASALDTPTKNLIGKLSPLHRYIVGGPASVSTGIQRSLEKLPGSTTVLRLGGANRFLTAQAVNSEVFPFADSAYVATGTGFADALAISAVAGVVGSPLLLSTYSCMPYDEVLKSTIMGVSTYFVVGGTSVLSPDVQNLTYCNPSLYSSSATQDAPAALTPAVVATTSPADAALGTQLDAAHARRK